MIAITTIWTALIAQELGFETLQQKEALAIAKDQLKKKNERRKAAEQVLRSGSVSLARLCPPHKNTATMVHGDMVTDEMTTASMKVA